MWIQVGHRFKFVIDGGKSYAVSTRYVQTKDEAGNLNNVFRFHERTTHQESLLRSKYPVMRIPELLTSDQDTVFNLELAKFMKGFDLDEEIQFADYSTSESMRFGPKTATESFNSVEVEQINFLSFESALD